MRPGRRRQLVDEVRATWRVSIRRACGVPRTDTSTRRHKSRRGDQAGLSKRVQEIARTRVRHGHRRVHVLLRREGWRANAKKAHRLYREAGLRLRSKAPRRRVRAKPREGRRPATRANETWAELARVPRAQRVEGQRRAWTSCTTSWRPGASCVC